MPIRIYNTLTNRKVAFVPVREGHVGIYLCGPTVYKPSHIGHAVGPIIFDAIKRYLVHKGFAVTWIVNVTDVEDKIIAEAAEQGCSPFELARRIEGEYVASMKALHVTGMDRMPRASEHIGDIIAFIERLIERSAAYVSGGDVYFDVTADDDYGKLSNRSIEDQTGQRELQSGEKRHPNDFALWKEAKPAEPDEMKFDSPWGKGRPGWHIECSVMSIQMLGETFDIHGGGLDLIFPHHENEVAQSETATGQLFSKYWMHHGLTRFNTKKVSKSDPQMQAALQQMTLSTLLQKYSGELLRYFVLSTQYRRPIEYSPEEIESKRKGLATFYRLFERIERISGESVYADVGKAEGSDAALAEEMGEFANRFERAMDDDFNTAAAIAVLFDQANAVNRFIEQNKIETDAGESQRPVAVWAGRKLVALGRLLGLFIEPPAAAKPAGNEAAEKVIAAAVAVRKAAKGAKDFATADMIRDRLAGLQVTLEDRPGETAWRIETVAGNSDGLVDGLMGAMIDIRKDCKSRKAFASADAIRDCLKEAGVTLEDRPDGTIWRAD